MTLSAIASAAAASTGGAAEVGKQKFGKVLEAARQLPPGESSLRAPQAGGIQPNPECARAVGRVGPGSNSVGRAEPISAGGVQSAERLLDRVGAAQRRMEEVLDLARSGKSFSPAELLALQADVYRASQQLDLAGKVVEKATSGVKQVLQTQV